MKTITSIATALLLFTSFSACNREDKTNPSTSGIIQDGTWMVTLYNDSGTDETNHFTAYDFTFGSSGTVTATKGASEILGSWNTGTDDSQNTLNLDFGATVPFDELNEDWHVIEKTESKLRLDHVSGGNGGTDLLTFEKK